MPRDLTPAAGFAGIFASLTLTQVNEIISLCVGLATLGYVVTKWALLFKKKREHRQSGR